MSNFAHGNYSESMVSNDVEIGALRTINENHDDVHLNDAVNFLNNCDFDENIGFDIPLNSDEDSDGNSYDEEEKEGIDLDVSERTSQILAEYRSFIAETEGNHDVEEVSRRADPDGIAAANKEYERGNDRVVFRDFPRDASGRSLTIFEDEMPAGGNEDGNEGGNGGENRQGRRVMTLFASCRSNVFKMGVLGIVASCLVVGSVVGSILSSNNGTSFDMDDTDPPRSQGHGMQSALPHTNIRPQEETIDVPTPNFVNDVPLQDDIHVPPKQFEQSIHNIEATFDPIWFDRSVWRGTTYYDAIKFCAKEDSRILCPFQAICPKGPLTEPVGGHRNGDEAWVPTIDSSNDWVSVSSKQSCIKYTSVHISPPSWGLSGKDSEDITRHISCCKDPYDVARNHLSGFHTESVTYNPAEKTVLNTLHPVWFGRENGYYGTTYDDAVEFCRNVGDRDLCPVEAYCPNGPTDAGKPMFLKSFAFHGKQWAPIRSPNRWVFVGSESNDDGQKSCTTYEQNHNEPPAWGVDGTNTELKKHVMCCTKEQHLLKEKTVRREHRPVWYNESNEWNGGSYDEATAFCTKIGTKLCPLTAYCPNGPGHPVIGGHDTDFTSEGPQWAPFSADGKGNQWVMIGTKYGNSLTTCMSYHELESGEPEWGLNGNQALMKKQIMCCSS